MESTVPEGWVQDSHTLYLHSSGVRIERRVYRNKEGWVLVPVDLDRAVVEFAPNTEGLEQAFAAFARGALGSESAAPPSRAQQARASAKRDETPEGANDDKEDEGEDEDEDDG
ncbi:MAG TPA: hypothetical protein VE981_12065 [Planctomycetota bacterium]|nr:hypothetical protein [Planctomycetota bacterium]